MNCQATRPERLPRVADHSSRLPVKVGCRDSKFEVPCVAIYHGKIVVLRTVVEAQPKTEAIGERNLLLDCLVGVDGGRTFILEHVREPDRWRRFEVA